jgi:hypothetical protein
MRLAISPNRIDIAEIELVGPEAELVVSEKRTLNLSRVLREREAHRTRVRPARLSPVPTALLI